MRVIRLLIYDGPEEWVLDTLDKNGVKGLRQVASDRSIRSIILGTMPDELLSLTEEEVKR
jgi:hypothetical protein